MDVSVFRYFWHICVQKIVSIRIGRSCILFHDFTIVNYDCLSYEYIITKNYRLELENQYQWWIISHIILDLLKKILILSENKQFKLEASRQWNRKFIISKSILLKMIPSYSCRLSMLDLWRTIWVRSSLIFEAVKWLLANQSCQIIIHS